MMMGLALSALLAAASGSFVADATAETAFIVRQTESVVLTRLRDIQTLRRTMPGVIAIEHQGNDRWLYRTERTMPFQDPVRTDFMLMRLAGPVVVFQTPRPDAANWMSFRFEATALDNASTRIRVRARVRLVRDDGADIHLFAPLLGEAFISDRMEEDLEGMLATFAESARRELEAIPGSPAEVTEIR